MAVSKQEVILEFNAETGDIDKSVVGLEAKIDKLADAIEYMGEQFGRVADSAQEADDAVADLEDTAKDTGKALEASADAGVTGFKAVGAALTATGLFGLLTKVLEPILAAFLENKTVADALKAVMAALGAVINNVVKVGEKLVDVLVDAFNNPQEALDTITSKVTELKDRFFEAFSSPGELLESLKEKVLGFGDTLKSYVTDKVTALIEGFGLLGKAISATFSGEFSKAAELAGEGLQKIYIEANPVADALKAVGGVVVETAKAVGEFVVQATAGATEAIALEQSMQRLADRERELAVETARSAAEVENLKRQRDDERLSIEERIKFAQEAAAIDQAIADENVAIQEEKARLLREEIMLQGETEERLQAVADAEIAVADARAASAGVQTELMTSIYGLNQEIITQEQEMASLRRGWNTELLEGLDAERAAIEEQYQSELASIEALKLGEEELEKLREEAKMARDARMLAADEVYRQEQIDALQGYYDESNAIIEENAVLTREKELENLRLDHEARIAQAQELEQETLSLQEALRLAEKEINDRYDQQELEGKKATRQAILDGTKYTLDLLSQLNKTFSGDSEKEQKKAFERSKKVQQTQALISTYESAIQAFKALAGIPVVGPALGAAAAGTATALGLANVQKIGQQRYQSPSQSGGAGGSTPSVSSGAGQGTPQAPQLDLSFLGEGAGQAAPVQAYVIATDVSNAQQANQQIQDQATL